MKYFLPQENLIVQDDQFVITSEQYIGDDFWREVERAKEEFDLKNDGYQKVASIPVAVVNKWIREGFDFDNATPQEIIDKLRIDEYSKFIISGDTRF